MDRSFEFVRRSHSRIVIGDDVATRLPLLLRGLGARVAIVHDARLTDLAARLASSLEALAVVAVPGDEAAKSLPQIGHLAEQLRARGMRRDTVLLGLGGGSITDCAGFLAAILLRGVPFVACPTTTLALCDAALGGKNGVDHAGRKNELGTIRQPDLIAADLAWLDSLPDALYREGFVEVVKKAAMLDAARFARLEATAPALRARQPQAAAEAIDMAVAMKMGVVLDDETERGKRRLLNFGHTLGHALESLAHGALRHGECVALGMLAECRAAGDAVPREVTTRLRALLDSLGAPTRWPREFADASALWRLASSDKKVRGDGVPLLVPRALGDAIEVPLTPDALASAVAAP